MDEAFGQMRGRTVRVDAPRRAVTLDEVRSRRHEIVRIGDRYGVRNIRVFGSVVRGEAGKASDLDLLVDVERGHGYFDWPVSHLGLLAGDLGQVVGEQPRLVVIQLSGRQRR